jgi:uncharacterized protein affecting Mg2+/Co2+ transport
MGDLMFKSFLSSFVVFGLVSLTTLSPSQADTVFNYSVTGFENASGTITPLTGFIDVDATSSNTGMITDYDLFTNGKEFNFSGLTLQRTVGGDVFGEYELQGKVGKRGASLRVPGQNLQDCNLKTHHTPRDATALKCGM